jgi:Flp pilus assembly pilin Flp
MPEVLERLWDDEEGQDIVEYALLVAFVGLVVLVAFLALQDAIHDGYLGWDARDQDLGSCTPGPDGAGCS